MPEGHTLHRLARDLGAAFTGERLRVGSPQGRFAASAEQLDGQVLQGAEAWGKHLFLSFPAERHIHIHLGLIGRFDLAAFERGVGPPAPVGQVRLRLVGERSYADLRGATACELWTLAEMGACVARLGPDPLRAPDEGGDPDRAWQRIRRSRSPIGGLLMNQEVVAGIGNVYRAELLFRHRIDPLRPGNTLRRGQWVAMWTDLVELMRAGVVANRIDTVRPEHTPEAMGRVPREDDHGGEVYVYRRTGSPCLICGTPVRSTQLQGRNLFWCPRCQRRHRPRTRTAASGANRRGSVPRRGADAVQ